MKNLKYIVIGLLLMLMPVMLIGCKSSGTIVNRIENITDTKLPKGMETIYSKEWETSLGGVKTLYAVFKTSEEPTEFLESLSFKERTDESATSIEKRILRILASIEDDFMQEEYLPNYENNFVWYENYATNYSKGYYFLYFTDTSELIVFIG